MADDLKTIVERMLAAGESEENIGTVIAHFRQQKPGPIPASEQPPVPSYLDEVRRFGKDEAVGFIEALDPRNLVKGVGQIGEAFGGAIMGRPEKATELVMGMFDQGERVLSGDPRAIGNTLGMIATPKLAGKAGEVASAATKPVRAIPDALVRGGRAMKAASETLPRPHVGFSMRGTLHGMLPRLGEAAGALTEKAGRLLGGKEPFHERGLYSQMADLPEAGPMPSGRSNIPISTQQIPTTELPLYRQQQLMEGAGSPTAPLPVPRLQEPPVRGTTGAATPFELEQTILRQELMKQFPNMPPAQLDALVKRNSIAGPSGPETVPVGSEQAMSETFPKASVSDPAAAAYERILPTVGKDVAPPVPPSSRPTGVLADPEALFMEMKRELGHLGISDADIQAYIENVINETPHGLK